MLRTHRLVLLTFALLTLFAGAALADIAPPPWLGQAERQVRVLVTGADQFPALTFMALQDGSRTATVIDPEWSIDGEYRYDCPGEHVPDFDVMPEYATELRVIAVPKDQAEAIAKQLEEPLCEGLIAAEIAASKIDGVVLANALIPLGRIADDAPIESATRTYTLKFYEFSLHVEGEPLELNAAFDRRGVVDFNDIDVNHHPNEDKPSKPVEQGTLWVSGMALAGLLALAFAGKKKA
ncbi:MAG: hypothetical protein ABI743_10485 [bacterium]